MKQLLIKLLWIIKKFVDKLYYSQYTADNEALIRQMFPWVNTMTTQDYSVINNFLISTSPADLSRLVQVITTFYWLEVNREILKNNLQWVIKYQWLIELCDSLTDFQRIYLAERAKELNT
jgi:hypothetical protein